MSNPIIPGFELPNHYNRTFLFEQDGFQCRIVAAGNPSRLEMSERGKATPPVASHCLDWIHETIEFVRQDVGA